jgi:hypothetical protein
MDESESQSHLVNSLSVCMDFLVQDSNAPIRFAAVTISQTRAVATASILSLIYSFIIYVTLRRWLLPRDHFILKNNVHEIHHSWNSYGSLWTVESNRRVLPQHYFLVNNFGVVFAFNFVNKFCPMHFWVVSSSKYCTLEFMLSVSSI